MKSIQMRLTVTILVIFFIALGVLGGLNYWKARSLIMDAIQENIAMQAADAAKGVGDWIDARRSETTMMSFGPVIQSGNFDAMLPFLSGAVASNVAYESISYANTSGETLTAQGLRLSVTDRDYFRRAMNGESSMTDPMVSRGTGDMIAIIAIPVKTGGKVTGEMSGVIKVSEIAKRVQAIKVGQTGYAYVVQSDGMFIMHPDKEMAMKYNPLKDDKAPPDLKAISQRLVKGEPGIGRYTFNGVEKILAFAPIPGTTWTLAVTVPTAEITGMVSSLTVISAVTIIIVLILAAFFITWFARRLAKPVQNLEAVANRIAGGDISEVKLGITSNDEIGRLGQSFVTMTANLRTLVRQILGATEQVAASSEELTANAEQSAQAANQVAIAITHTAQSTDQQLTAVASALDAVGKIAAGTQREAANTKQAVEITNRAVAAAASGNEAVETAIRQMNAIQTTVNNSAGVVSELGERSKEIGQIVETISNIAGQTNLLALNAAIEAARAGEHGRGFAVVAEEVRKLAEDSQDAATQIAALIGEIQVKTGTAVAAMTSGTAEVKKGTQTVDQAGTAFKNIMVQIKEVAAIAQKASDGLLQLAASSEQVLTVVKDVDAASRGIADQAQNISATTEEQSASMQEIAASSKALADLAEQLQTAVRQFKV